MSSQPTAPRVIRFGLFELDSSAGELRKQDLRIKLQDQPFQTLVLLVSRPGELVSREDLQKALWPADTFIEFDQGLNTAIKKIRLALGDSADNPRFIETVPRKGYRFIAPVEGNRAPAPAPTLGSRRHLLWAMALFAFTVCTGAVGW
jgi:DNA-binding winged helix-turn-helix (wHTH) protein